HHAARARPGAPPPAAATEPRRRVRGGGGAHRRHRPPASPRAGVSQTSTAITACVIARDEAANLNELLPSLRWADEVLVVVDDASEDESEAVARPLADRVEIRRFVSFPAFRNTALDLAGSPWIFFVDADERVSADLADEVRAAVQTSEAALARGGEPPVGYLVGPHNIHF